MNLASLALIDISESEANKWVSKLDHLPKLSSLTIKLAYGSMPEIRLPSLTSLSIGVCSTSQLQQTLVGTPGLARLDVQLIADVTPGVDKWLPLPLTTEIRRLKLELPNKANITFDDLAVLFKWMPKLRALKVIAANGFRLIRGRKWEELIRTYLPQLEEFRFKFHPNLSTGNPEQLLAAFQFPLRVGREPLLGCCDHYSVPHPEFYYYYAVHSYTLPYIGEQFYLCSSIKAVGNVNRDEYRSIKNLRFTIDCPYNPSIAQHYYFPHLDSLSIRNLHKVTPMDDLIDLSQVKHLTVERNNPMQAEEFLSCLLLPCTSLHSLELSWDTLLAVTNKFTDSRVCPLLNKQIKNLDLHNMISSSDDDTRAAIENLNRLFSAGLEKFSVSLASPENIPWLLNGMSTLHSIRVECNPSDSIMDIEQFMSWLTRNVPRLRNFTYQLRLAAGTRVCLVLWIGN